MSENNEFDTLKYYLDDIGKQNIPSKSEEKELLREIKNGNKEAKKEFITRNLKLVVAIASKYKNSNIELIDLISEGNEGLIKAIDGYNINNNANFSTYATYWIKKYICEAISDKSLIIRIPRAKSRKIYQYKRNVSNLEAKLGYKPSYSEIQEFLGITNDEIKALEQAYIETISLDCEILEQNSLKNIIGDDRIDIENDYDQNDLKNEILKLLENSNLSEKEKKIIIQKYLVDKPPTLECLGNRFNLTRERVRQIEKTALNKLRITATQQNLNLYLKNK